jgi:WD40 repeat protein/serine/threonine protein kinase
LTSQAPSDTCIDVQQGRQTFGIREWGKAGTEALAVDWNDPAARDLLLSVLAIRQGLISPGQLTQAFDAWGPFSHKRLRELLTEHGALEAEAVARLDALADLWLLGQQDVPELSLTVAYGPHASGITGATPPSQERDRHPGVPDEVARFRVIRHHARGGLGEVFLAVEPELDRQVALKELQAYHAHNPSSQSRFLLEARLTGRLEHPGIVPVYGLGRHADGRPFYAMRFIEGETLKSAIERYHASTGSDEDLRARDLAFRRLILSLITACNAVAYAHSRGVIHRDLKPENIMLGRFGETLVVDWGVAKALGDPDDQPAYDRAFEEHSSLTRPGAAVGTPRYMSPEQAQGDLERIGPASDIYGLGATLYCILVGHSPFPEDDLETVLYRAARGIFPAPRRLRRTIDPALEAICLRAMASRPEDRQHSALILAGELESWLADARYRGEQVEALTQVKTSFVRLCIERSHNLFQRRKENEGMLWLVRALENLPENVPGLERVVRSSLGSWYARGRLMERQLVHSDEVLALAFSPDGRRLATACNDGTARLWDVATGRTLAGRLGHEAPVSCVAFSPDGACLATACTDGTVRFWNATTGRPLGTNLSLGTRISAIKFSSDGLLLAAASRLDLPVLWQISDRRPRNAPLDDDCHVVDLAFSPDGSMLATGCQDGRIIFWDAATGLPLGGPMDHGKEIRCLCFSPHGGSVVSGCLDHKARIWEVESRAIRREFTLSAPVRLVAWSPNGKAVATACDDGHARLWNPDSGQPIGEPLVHEAPIACLEFCSDGTLLATGSSDRAVRVWDTDTGLPIGPPLEHRGGVKAVAFSPDRRRLDTGSSDCLARFWMAAPPITGLVERIGCWIRVTSDLDFDEGDAIRKLDPLVGWELRRRLHELGGPPHR